MFTQKHYEAIADMIQDRRACILTNEPKDNPSPSATAQILALNDLVMLMTKKFKADNPKFRELIFIARCNRDLAT